MLRIIVILAATLAVLAVSVASASGASAGGPHVNVTVRVDRSHVVGVSRMDVGVTHTRFSLDPWGNAAAVARGQALLTGTTGYQNQFTYGWGVTNPEPAPGVFDWTSLDQRVNMMRSIGGKLVLTLCCAPDWMTQLGTETSNYPVWPPTPNHYKDFADLVRRIAQRYPDIHHYIVWSELRGFWDYNANNWDYTAYTNMYNAVYDALKGVNPNIKVGGPYIILEGSGTNRGNLFQEDPILQRNMEVINYWLQHKHGADFITLDRTAKADHDPMTYPVSQVLGMTYWFQNIIGQVRKLTNLPVWYAEERFQGGPWQLQAAGLASIMYYELKGGAAASLSWEPQGTSTNVYGGNYQNLFSDTRVAGGGQPFPYYRAYKDFHLYFGPGTRLYRTSSSSSDVEVLASATHTLIINTMAHAIVLRVNGRIIHMKAYGVRLLAF